MATYLTEAILNGAIIEQVESVLNEIADEWEEKIGDNGDEFHKKLINPEIFNFLKNSCEGVKKILDVGCGNGYMVKLLRDEGYDAYGMDISRNMINNAKKRVPEEYLRVDDVQKINPLEYPKFDCIIMSMVLDQVPDIDKAINNVYQLLDEGGYLIVILPHPSFYLYYGNFVENVSIDKYNNEGRLNVILSGISRPLPYHHRKLETYLNCFISHNFEIIKISEPVLPDSLKRKRGDEEYPAILSILLKKGEDKHEGIQIHKGGREK